MPLTSKFLDQRTVSCFSTRGSRSDVDLVGLGEPGTSPLAPTTIRPVEAELGLQARVGEPRDEIEMDLRCVPRHQFPLGCPCCRVTPNVELSGLMPCGVSRCMGLGSAAPPCQGALPWASPRAAWVDCSPTVSAGSRSGRPENFVQRPRTPSREPTAIASSRQQNAAERSPSTPHTAMRRWCKRRRSRPLWVMQTRHTESSDDTETSQRPVDENETVRTPARSQKLSCRCCSRIQPQECQTRSVWSTLQETIRDSYSAFPGDEARQFTASMCPLRVFSRVSENAFQICSWPFWKPQAIHHPEWV
mmetsp:Transcript_18264/g.51697  ORF Transcript_18264/g.51697 Transcript_18264/m.51697 type:complete len:304 (-) Transcript_18264:737-1648(-)